MAEQGKKSKKWQIFIGVMVAYALMWAFLKFVVAGFVSPEPGQMVAFTADLPIQIANFLVLYYAMYRILYKPVLGFIEDRNNTLARQRADSEADREKARETVAKTEKELERIRLESSGMLREAREDAGSERSKILERAEGERAAMMDKAEKEISLEIEKAKAQLREQIAGYSVQIAEQIIVSSQSKEDLQKMAEDSLAQMETQALGTN